MISKGVRKDKLAASITVTIKGNVSTFNAYAKLIAIGIKIITAALLVTKFVKSDININKLHNINAIVAFY